MHCLPRSQSSLIARNPSRAWTTPFWLALVVTPWVVGVACGTAAESSPPGCLLLLDATRLAPHAPLTPPNGVAPLSIADEHDGVPIDIWPDASGLHHDAVQLTPDAQPHLIGRGSAAAVRFDGVASHLTANIHASDLTHWTLATVIRPRGNRGGFRAVASGSAQGQNDYTSGFNVDFGSPRSWQLNLVNVEGPGFEGMADLCESSFDFGRSHLLTITATPGDTGVRVFIDGRLVGSRPHSGAPAQVDTLFVAARSYDNAGQSPHASGFFQGDLAELRFYDRALADEERQSLESALRETHADFLAEEVPVVGGPQLERVPLETGRFFVPGFDIRPLPLDLPNLNALCYRHDGTLVAGGYDGTIWLLSDTDGDGLEDTAREYFRSPTMKAVMGMAVTPPHDPRGPGVFVVTVGRVVFIPDADGDGTGDREQVIAEGWASPEVSAGGVSDAMGAALGPDGSLYFSLGTPNFTNAYLVDEHGKAHYDVAGERGTIQRISPDFASRETVCTGIRFAFGIAFDASGQLFCTDQEGATWLPNGNPYDELHAIQPGRHYGFPPQHHEHLPNVIDEPSLFDFQPQHQSACGLLFNEPAGASERAFGPSWWQGNALVCGESRGRLFRLEVVNAPSSEGAPAAFIARGHPLGTLAMMPIDAAVSPRGDLLIACHSGTPDWGSGPAGRGSIYRIRQMAPEWPQPRFAYTSSPQEVRIVFDCPVPPAWLARTVLQSRIDFGRSVSAGDRFEQCRPGYSVVTLQEEDARESLAIDGVQLSPDGRTVILATAPHRANAPHGLSLALAAPATEEANAEIASTELVYHPHGVLAEWRDASGDVRWSGWLPSADTRFCRPLTAGSAHHEQLWSLTQQPGTLSLTTSLALSNMLQPEYQRDHRGDLPLQAESVCVAFTGQLPLLIDGSASPQHTVAITSHDVVKRVTLTAETGPGFDLRCWWHTTEDPRPRVMPLHRFVLPWAGPLDATPQPTAPSADLAGGDWERGQALFYGDEASCSRCHRVDGKGGWIGPDLSNLHHRDPHAVRRDITEPNATLNPEHLAHVLTLTDGRVLSGIVRPEGDRLTIGLIDGSVLAVDSDEVEDMQPSAVSIMPTGLAEKLGEARLRDLLVFLTTPSPALPTDRPAGPHAAGERDPRDESVK